MLDLFCMDSILYMSIILIKIRLFIRHLVVARLTKSDMVGIILIIDMSIKSY